ncbi:MAG: sodium/glutamate symporter [Patescibacteria group bacterium]|nr:sodium/glutamate symporter [Patescibacteria group bacterium]
MNVTVESLMILAAIILAARFLKRKNRLLKKYSIPSSLVAGILGLFLGPQLLGFIPKEIVAVWAGLPKHLISIVFAGLFLGRAIPKFKDIWRMAGPQIAFGNTIAWGQYLVGSLVALLFLIPFFGANPKTAALIEISFEGGHGTAAGLAPTFEALGFSEGTDIALALATLSIFCAIISGMIIINLSRAKRQKKMTPEDWKAQERASIRGGYNLINIGKKISNKPQAIVTNIIGFALAIGIGSLILRSLISVEGLVLGGFTNIRFFPYVPLFPLAMIGGLLLQLALRKINLEEYINRRVAEIISALALDILIVSAVSTISLKAINNNLLVFLTLAFFGVAWILFSFYFFAPRMFPTFWFEKGLTNIGQSMGTTATGLMLLRQVDPGNKSKARESFAYKQLVFEPFMGGGIITATSMILIHEFGLLPFLIISFLAMIFWIWLGFRLKRIKTSQKRK